MPEAPKPTFYDPTPAPVMGADGKPVIHNRIANQLAAREIADVEKTQGVDVALRREQELLRQHETGLTDLQRRNLEIMDGLALKYPDALIEKTDSLGRRVLLLETYGTNSNFSDTIFCLNGVATIHPSNQVIHSNLTDIDLTPVVSGLEEGPFPHRAERIKTDHVDPISGSKSQTSIDYIEVNLGDENRLKDLKAALNNINKIKAERNKALAEKARKQTTEQILSQL